MTITDLKVQAAYNELRHQRDMALDRCANLVQEIAVRDQKIAEMEGFIETLSKQLSASAEEKPVTE